MNCVILSRNANKDEQHKFIDDLRIKLSPYYKSIFLEKSIFKNDKIDKEKFLLFDVKNIDKNNEWLTIIYDDQCFLDTKIVSLGIKKINKINRDIYSQELHVTLPLGIGMTAIRTKLLGQFFKLSCNDVDKLLKDKQNSIYFDNKLVDFNHNYMFDSTKAASDINKFNKLLDKNNITVNKITWDLEGFNNLIRDNKNIRNFFSIKLDFKVSKTFDYCFDIHGKEVNYGFETLQGVIFPQYVMFDVTNQCNAKCIHCPQSIGFEGDDNPTFLSKYFVKDVIDECKKFGTKFIRFTGDGEPLLHKDIWEILSYSTKNTSANVGLTSNGSGLNQKNREKLLSTNLDMIDISLDAATKSTFAVVRVGLDFEKTVNNVLSLIKMRNETGSKLKIMVSFVKQFANEFEATRFKKFWTNKADQVLIRDLTTNVNINNEAKINDKELDRWACPHWFRRTVINYDGRIKACPIDWNAKLISGHLSDGFINKNWNSFYYYSHRMQHLNNDIEDTSLCKTCRDWKSTPWSMGYEKVVEKLAI